MSIYVESAQYIYSEAGEIYLDLVVENPQNVSVSPVSIAQFRNDPDNYLHRGAHLIIGAEIAVIKEVMAQAMDRDISVGLLPLAAQRTLNYSYGIPEDTTEMLDLSLSNSGTEIDLVFCNDTLLLFKGVIGRVPLFDSMRDAGRVSIVWDGIKNFFSLRLLPFGIETNGQIKRKIDTAASGCLILENAEGSFAASMIDDDCSSIDGSVSAVIVAPFSIIDYWKLMLHRMTSGTRIANIETSIGYIKSSDLTIDSSNELSVTIDGEKVTTTPAHFMVKGAALKINRGTAVNTRLANRKAKGEKYAVKSLPAGKELSKATNKRVPFFTYASEERFKELFIALRDDARIDSTYIVLMILSTTLATVGLFLDSASVVIGAMLLAPLMAPIISLAMSILRYDRKLFRQSLWKICVGIFLALATAYLWTLISPYQPMTGEMEGRLHPTVLDLIVAIAAGVAGAYTKSHKEIMQSLAGVAIAVALVPPLAVAGIGLGRFNPQFFAFAFLLFTTNLIGIILAATFTFRVLGYSPVVRDKRGMALITIFFLLISIPLSLSFHRITEQTKFEESWQIERFLVNGKYLIVDDAKMTEFKGHAQLEVELQARELMTRYDLSEFRRKVKQNFDRDLVIRANITYIP